MSKESLESQSTINTNSLLRDGEKTPPYQDIDDDLDNFKFPDLSVSICCILFTCKSFGHYFLRVSEKFV